MFDDDAYDLDKGGPRWIVETVTKPMVAAAALRVVGFCVWDTESGVSLKAIYEHQDDAQEVCGILNQYEADIALMAARRDNGHGTGPNGH